MKKKKKMTVMTEENKRRKNTKYLRWREGKKSGFVVQSESK